MQSGDPVPPVFMPLAEALDGLDVALCVFDGADRTLLWNRTFLRFFPEHEGHVHRGESYAENLRRFYREKLTPEEMPLIERYVADGIERHRTQARPFVFRHRDQWVRVAASALPDGGRMRIWTRVPGPEAEAVLAPAPEEGGVGLLAEALENMAEGVALLNPDGLIAGANERFLALYGATRRGAVLGRSYAAVLERAWEGASPDAAERAALGAALARLAEDQAMTGAPFETPLPGGRTLRVTERLAADGHVWSIHADVTDMKRQQRAIAAARDAADQANRAKSAFLAMMSHEIRTPMNGILGMAELLLEGPLDRAGRDHAEALHGSATALLSLLNDILDATKLEAAKLRLETIPFDLPALIREMARLMGPLALAKGIRLVAALDPDLPRIVRGDPSRLRQVLLNLLSNALKFTAEGEVRLVAARAGPAPTIRLEVLDTGIGIAPEVVGRLFGNFEQADASIARRYGGTGLGLSIARQLVELMGGRIGTAPRHGAGSLFWCELPLPEAEGNAPPAAPAAGSAPLCPAEVLLVEDNATNRHVARAFLERAGCTVRIAADGAAAIAQARLRPPALVLLDIQLPDMDGFEVLRQLRDVLPPAPRVPVVAVTANAMPEDRARCLAGGMDDYLPKPFSLRALEATIRRWLPVEAAGGEA